VTLRLAGPQAGVEGELTVGVGYPPRDLLRTVLLSVAAFGAVAAVWLRERFGRRTQIDDGLKH
jgi:hypothetical protein